MVNLVTTLLLAHIKLTEPASFQVTDGYGTPNKTAPCGGAGQATNVVTTVEAGSQLTVSWTEPVYHPGHFRISIAQTQGEFVTPVPVLNNGACGTAPVEDPVAYPTVVDGLFEHSSAGSGSWTTTITVPADLECEHCTLQLMQFMSQHSTPCFYYQCATLKIVKPGSDAGLEGLDGGDSDAGTADGGSGSSDGGSSEPGPADGGADSSDGDSPTQGCSCDSAGGAMILAALTVLVACRRQLKTFNG